VNNPKLSEEPEDIFLDNSDDIASSKIVDASWKAVSNDETIPIDGEGRCRRSVGRTMKRVLACGQFARIDESDVSVWVTALSSRRFGFSIQRDKISDGWRDSASL
jgi:hypothetical protein